jgi:hypothetical protein
MWSASNPLRATVQVLPLGSRCRAVDRSTAVDPIDQLNGLAHLQQPASFVREMAPRLDERVGGQHLRFRVHEHSSVRRSTAHKHSSTACRNTVNRTHLLQSRYCALHAQDCSAVPTSLRWLRREDVCNAMQTVRLRPPTGALVHSPV